MNRHAEFTANASGARLDAYVAEHAGISRALARKLVDQGHVTLNGHCVKASHRIEAGDRVAVTLPPPAPTEAAPESMPLSIVYEDRDVIVLDKPAGLVVHPTANRYTGTLVNALIAHCPELGGAKGSLRPGIVHRLDKDTSGLMMVAKNESAQDNLARQIKERRITKAYVALVRGHLTPEHGAIEAPIGRNPNDRKRMAVVSGGREARTLYEVNRYVSGCTLLEVVPETGRTHQIRVHLSSIGHPVFGDRVYGRRSSLLARQFLHACRLGFRLPSTGRFVEFTSDLPGDLQEALGRLAAGEKA